MFRLYTIKRTRRIVDSLSPLISRVARDYHVPVPLLKAVMFRETKEIDLFDLIADFVVNIRPFGSLLNRTDSSTGYMQIFGYVGIKAINFAEKNHITTMSKLGLDAGHRLEPGNKDDVRMIWLRLHQDKEFNLRVAALNILAAADEVKGSRQLDTFSEEEIKRVFSRYNANTTKITAYGEEVYGYYQKYCSDNMKKRNL
jgi:hypothetical protein